MMIKGLDDVKLYATTQLGVSEDMFGIYLQRAEYVIYGRHLDKDEPHTNELAVCTTLLNFFKDMHKQHDEDDALRGEIATCLLVSNEPPKTEEPDKPDPHAQESHIYTLPELLASGELEGWTQTCALQYLQHIWPDITAHTILSQEHIEALFSTCGDAHAKQLMMHFSPTDLAAVTSLYANDEIPTDYDMLTTQIKVGIIVS